MPKMNIFTNLKKLIKNIPIINFGKAEPIPKPEPLTPVKPRPDIEPPRPVKPKEYDK